MLIDDSEVWKKMTDGDATAFDTFYRDNAPRLQAFLRQIVGNAQAAEDVSQETFTRIWHRPQGYEPESGTLRAYLFGIGRKLAVEWWRKQRPSESLTEDTRSTSHTELNSIVGDAFHRLPEEQRTLLWLREVEGQSYTELAATLDIPIGTVRSRLYTAREALRTIWHSNANNTKGGAS